MTSNPTTEALAIGSVKSAYFFDQDTRGVVYDSATGQEFDVRAIEDGWLVSDDEGTNFENVTLTLALTDAIKAGQKEAP